MAANGGVVREEFQDDLGALVENPEAADGEHREWVIITHLRRRDGAAYGVRVTRGMPNGGAPGPEVINIEQKDVSESGEELPQSPLFAWPEDVITIPAGARCRTIARVRARTLKQIVRARISADITELHRLSEVESESRPVMAVSYGGVVFDDEETRGAVDAILDKRLVLGSAGKALSSRLENFLTVKRSVLVNSGSSANLVAVAALRSPLLGTRALQPGDEIITVAGGFPTTVNPIIQNQCIPVFVDNDVASGNIRTDRFEAAISSRTRAVILAHMLGNPFDIDYIKRLCDDHGLWLIEDNCDALGSTYRGKKTGGFGDLSTLSFYPAHHLAVGQGGAVNVTSDDLLAKIVQSLAAWGRDCWCGANEDNVCGRRFGFDAGRLGFGYDHKYIFSHIGYNLMLSEPQAAIGVAQLKKLPEFITRRAYNWSRLHQVFSPFDDFFDLPSPEPHSEPSWYAFKIVIRDNAPFERGDLVRHFEERNIQTRTFFGGNLTCQPAYLDAEKAGFTFRVSGSLDGADKLMRDSIFIGVHPVLTDAHLDYVRDALDGFIRRLRRTSPPIARGQ